MGSVVITKPLALQRSLCLCAHKASSKNHLVVSSEFWKSVQLIQEKEKGSVFYWMIQFFFLECTTTSCMFLSLSHVV